MPSMWTLWILPVVVFASVQSQHDHTQTRLGPSYAFLEADHVAKKSSRHLTPSHKDDEVSMSDTSLNLGVFLASWPGYGWIVGIAAAGARSGIEPSSSLLETTPSSSLNVFHLIGLVLIVIGFAWAWIRTHSNNDDADSATQPKARVDREWFKTAADKGELDFYTCVALSTGRYKGSTAMKFVPKLLVLAGMQLLLGLLLLVAQQEGQRQEHYYPTPQGPAFRTVGVLLFVYSVYNLASSMDDECREMLIRFLQAKSTSGWYEWPLLLGEWMNTLVGFMLMVILFAIFCQTQRAESLLMNCIAVNFVADIDNDLVTEDDTAEALENLEIAAVELEAEREEGLFLDKVQFAVLLASNMARLLIWPVAAGLTFFFAFAHNDALCHQLKDVSPWPFCLGVDH